MLKIVDMLESPFKNVSQHEWSEFFTWLFFNDIRQIEQNDYNYSFLETWNEIHGDKLRFDLEHDFSYEDYLKMLEIYNNELTNHSA